MLITSRTPLRVSLFGGGTDYPAYFESRPGAVIGMAIDKHIYISALEINAWQGYNLRLSYSKIEHAVSASEIEHPVVRAILLDQQIDKRLDLNVIADLPAASGLGSSSAFTVGVLNLMAAIHGRSIAKMDLAKGAMRVEQELLAENVGVQDQLHTAFGGLNRFDFCGKRFSVSPVSLHSSVAEALNKSLVLIHTGRLRRATNVAAAKIENIKNDKSTRDLQSLYDMVGACQTMLEEATGPSVIQQLGEMLHEGWEVKRRLSASVTDPEIDDLYSRARAAGGIGGKLCGAGGGGFILMVVPPERREALSRQLAPNAVIPIGMDVQGSSILGGLSVR